jgi:hypothetical protein
LLRHLLADGDRATAAPARRRLVDLERSRPLLVGVTSRAALPLLAVASIPSGRIPTYWLSPNWLVDQGFCRPSSVTARAVS